MELKEFIESGMLESYLLGTATAEEIRMVNSMMAKHPEVKSELDSIEKTLLNIAKTNAPDPSQKVKEKILQEIHSTTNVTPDNNTVPITKNKSLKLLRYGIAASIALLIISITTNIVMMTENIGMQNKLSQLDKQNVYIQNEFNQIQSQYATITHPDCRPVKLKGLDISPESFVTVYWNKPNTSVHLLVNNLVPAPEGKQYQLWAIVDGKPMDAGVFDCTPGAGIQTMKNIPNAQAFAVTLENKGGSPTPTMEAMYVMGEV